MTALLIVWLVVTVVLALGFIFRSMEVRGLRADFRREEEAKRNPPPPPPRKGIITAQFVGAGLINKGAQYNITADVIEEAVAGGNSLEVLPSSTSLLASVRARVASRHRFVETTGGLDPSRLIS